MAEILHNAVIGYWVLLNLLIAIGGVLGWIELRNIGRPRVVLYLSRVVAACALSGISQIVTIRRFHHTLGSLPVDTTVHVLATTAMCGAIWGWLLYTRGIINGGGVLGLVGRLINKPERSNKAMKEDNKQPAKELVEEADKAETENDKDDGDNSDSPGVPDGPGKGSTP